MVDVNPRRRRAREHAPPQRPRPAGRPRDPRVDRAIVDEARELLSEVGYGAMTLDAVAVRAGTSMPALRRRYASKPDLVMAVVMSLRNAEIPAPTDDPRTDARAILNDLNRALLTRSAMTIVGSLLAEQNNHPELLAHFSQHVVSTRRNALRDALQRGVSAGQLHVTDLEAATSMLCGSLYGQYLTPEGLSENWADRAIALLWPDET